MAAFVRKYYDVYLRGLYCRGIVTFTDLNENVVWCHFSDISDININGSCDDPDKYIRVADSFIPGY